MREDTTNTRSVFDELSNAAANKQSESESESYETIRGTATGADAGTDAGNSVERELDSLLEQVQGALATDDIQFDEALIKENLDEVLLMLIALREETHGKELLSDLTHLFDATLSPGTVYPALHDLKEEDVLAMHTKVRTKEYSIDDEAYVREAVEQTMRQHLAFGLLLYAFLARH
ncbi:helix-turn-helix transcriptional regulator [Halopiger xanaduensis]|uniref:Transcriptional regulator PadR family protein n=1 Tax=Halopiger xanaduensis (strain DSM 18323 / JCM 14033 / SH-6) TaxID=797210 RepID=F8DA75_HALXS|nr:helix-turn-helix transcriptional regulator [Halopiger xanaduensis]AEH38147.1 transcriptional regulator PadR family protein [Halopiger xanaduensis SH-6]